MIIKLYVCSDCSTGELRHSEDPSLEGKKCAVEGCEGTMRLHKDNISTLTDLEAIEAVTMLQRETVA